MKQQTTVLRVVTIIIMICCIFLFLVWSMTIQAEAHQQASISSYQITPTIASAVPTIDPTVTTLEKTQLAEEVTNLQNQNNWLWSFGVTIGSTVLLTLTGLAGIFRYFADRSAERKKQTEEQARWLQDRESERDKRAEERFQTIVSGLGNEKIEARIGSAILLRTFLAPDYKQFYRQAFDLSVAYLRSPKSNEPLESTLHQALITIFKESFSLARDELKEQKGDMYSSELLNATLNATNILLDNASLNQADLGGLWLLQASLKDASLEKTQLMDANLNEANLKKANLNRAILEGAKLERADLTEATLEGTNLMHAELRETHLGGANLRGAKLQGGKMKDIDLENADLTGAHLESAKLISAKLKNANLEGASLAAADLTNADLTNANLKHTNLREANLSGANLSGANLKGTHPETAKSLQDTNIRDVKGLTQAQLDICAKNGAKIIS